MGPSSPLVAMLETVRALLEDPAPALRSDPEPAPAPVAQDATAFDPED